MIGSILFCRFGGHYQGRHERDWQDNHLHYAALSDLVVHIALYGDVFGTFIQRLQSRRSRLRRYIVRLGHSVRIAHRGRLAVRLKLVCRRLADPEDRGPPAGRVERCSPFGGPDHIADVSIWRPVAEVDISKSLILLAQHSLSRPGLNNAARRQRLCAVGSV